MSGARSAGIRTAQLGLSLIELMVAMAIGLLLLLGLVQVMGASRASYQLSEGIARTQENARFAIDFIQRDLRMAGHLGCVNDQARSLPGGDGVRSHTAVDLRFDLGVQGFEAPGTGPGASSALAGGDATSAPSNNWLPQLPADIFGMGPVAGSDVLMIRYLAPVGAGLSPVNGFTPSAGGGAVIRPIEVPNAALDGIADGATALFGMADCSKVSIFPGQVDLAGGTVTFDPAGLPIFTGDELYDAGQGTLHRAHSVAYFVAPGSNGSNPSLYRVEQLFDGTWLAPEELVEGIESMQLMFGRDYATSPARPTGTITRSDVASSIGGGASNPNAAQSDDWRRVGDVQVGLLMRSTSAAASAQAEAAPSVLGTQMVIDNNDGNYRSVYETTVALRNRLFGN